MRTLKKTVFACGIASALLMTGCSSTGKGGPVPMEYLSGTTLDRNPIRVAERTAYLEVKLNVSERPQ